MFINLHTLIIPSAKLYLFYSPPTPVDNFPPLKPQHLQTSPKTPTGVMYYNSFISVSMLQGQHPIIAAEQFSPLRKVPRCHAAHYSAPRTDQPPARAVASSVYPAALSSLGRFCGTKTKEQKPQIILRPIISSSLLYRSLF